MYHYTYLIKHKTKNLKYIGVRTSKCLPTEDTNYWGSSKHLPKNVKDTHKKRVLSVFSSRKEAVAHEVYLHNKYDVVVNPCFYNKAKQTTVAFDTTGITLVFTDSHKQKISNTLKGKKKTDEHRKALSKAQKRLASSPDYKNPRKGVVMSDKQKLEISAAKKANGNSRGITNSRFSPWFVTEGNITHLYYGTTKDEQSILEGFHLHTYRNLCKRSKGVKAVTKGTHKGKIVGNIPT